MQGLQCKGCCGAAAGLLRGCCGAAAGLLRGFPQGCMLRLCCCKGCGAVRGREGTREGRYEGGKVRGREGTREAAQLIIREIPDTCLSIRWCR